MLALTAVVVVLAPAGVGAQDGSGGDGTGVETGEPGEDGTGATDEGGGAGEEITGTLQNRDADGEPIVGVEVVVARDGEEIGRGVSGDDGGFAVEVPGPGVYEVTLLVDTLPEGVSLRNPDRATLEDVDVRAGQSKVVLFPVGGSAGSERGPIERFLQLVAQGLRLGLIIAMAAVGLSLIFGLTGLVNFAQGEMVTFGALVAFFFSAAVSGPGWPLELATVFAVILGGALGAALELVLWRPLRRRRMTLISQLVVSIGLALFLRSIFLAIFGGNPRPFADYAVQRAFEIGPVALAPKDYVIMIVSLVVLLGVALMLQKTRLGTSMRAVADNKDLAEASGIDVQRVILSVWIAGGALAGLAGVLYALTEQVQWDIGLRLLLLMFAAVVLGGLGTAYGPMLGGLVIGVTSEVSSFWFPTDFKVVFALAVLIIVLLFRPQGILGVRERVG